MQLLLDDPTLSAMDRRRWEMAQSVLEELAVQGQSSEESDAEVPGSTTLFVTVPRYRRRVLGDLFADLDRAIELQTEKVQTEAGKRYRKRAAHIRVRSETKSEGKAISDLPLSCYHRKFIRSLNPVPLQMLNAKPKEIPLFDAWAATQGDSDSMDE